MPRILRLSLRYFCSSSVSPDPSSTSEPASGHDVVGDRGREIRAAGGKSTAAPSKVSRAARSAVLRQLARPARPRRRGPPPRPPGRWTRSSRRSPASSCSGLSTGMATMVVQLGLATMPLGIDASVGRVDLGHHQRHLGVHPPGRGVVDHDAPRRRPSGARAPATRRPRPSTGRCRCRRSRRSAASSTSTSPPPTGRRGRPSGPRRRTGCRRAGSARSTRTGA